MSLPNMVRAVLPEPDMPEVNAPDVVAELGVLHDAYERALAANDVPALTAFFWDSPHTVRYGVGEHLYGAGAGRESSSANPTGHQIDEDAHAGAAAEWLNRQVVAHRIEKLVIIASPRTLGEMRRHYHKQLQGALVAELAKDLIGRSAHDILATLRAK